MTPVEEIKEKIKLEDVIGESLTVVGRGRTLTTKEHDSLKIFTATQTWHQFSSGQGGDIFDWWQREQRCDFRQALEALAQRAGVELRPMSDDERRVVNEDRREVWRRFEIWEMAASYYEAVLWSPAGSVARDYCATRGWDVETIRRERIGFAADFSSTDNKALSVQELGIKNQESGEIVPLHRQLREAGLADHALARAVLSLPAGMIVYCHRDERGRVAYLSGRSIEGKKRHFNMPEETAGAKQAYLNEPVKRPGGDRVMVEGQADAISFGMMGVTAVALCGMAVSALPGKFSHVALDNDAAAQKKNTESREPGQVARALELALSVDPLCKVVLWPEKFTQTVDGQSVTYPIKDANDMLRVTPGRVEECLDDAPYAIVRLADDARKAKGEERKALMDRFFTVYTELDPMTATDLKPLLAKFFGGVNQFHRMRNAYLEEQKAANESPAGERFEVCPGKYVGGYLFEQFVEWNEDGVPLTYFWVRYPNGELKRQLTLDVGSVSYVPIKPDSDENIREQTVLFPNELDANYGGEKDLLDQIRRFIHRWMDMDSHMERIASYYVLFSWFYDAGFETVPYMRALGDYGTGKTRFIETIGYLCFRPMLISGGDSEPVIFRMINTYRGTMVVDEADFKDSEANALIAKIINMGNRISGNIKRIGETPEGEEMIRVYKTFCPKVFASRQGFQDQAMDSRCLTYYTTKSNPRPDVPKDTDITFREEARLLRNKLAHYRLKTWKPMQVNHSLTDNTIMARLAQVTLALRSIITDPKALAELDRFIHEYNQDLIQDRGMSREAIVVRALAEIWFVPTGLYGERDLSITGIAEKSQAILVQIDPEDKPFTPRGVGEILNKRLGLRGREKLTERKSQNRNVLTFDEAMLLDLMKRYGVDRPDEGSDLAQCGNV